MKGFKNSIRMNPYLRWVLVLSNWLSQGIPHSDTTEKSYKIFFTIVFSGLFFVILTTYYKLQVATALTLGILIGHTLNWIVNSNFSNIIIHRLFISTVDKGDIFIYLESLKERLKKNKSIISATSHGSICSGNLKPNSDLDVALVRNKGFSHAIKALYFIVHERKLADLKGIPLEIYLMDDLEAVLKRFKGELNPVVLYDPFNMVDEYYSDKLTVIEAKKLNGINTL